MTTPRARITRVAAGFTLAALALAAAPQAGQTVDAGGLKFALPAGWKSNPPSNAMRKAELVAPAAEGDKEPAQMVITAFPGGAGGIEANIERWEGQFRDASGRPPKATSTKVKTKGGQEAVRVEVGGTFTEPTFGRGEPVPKPNYRLLGAIIQGAEGSYFVKMTGPEKTIKQATAAFDKLVETAEVTR